MDLDDIRCGGDVLVFFWRDRCRQCKSVSEAIDDVERKYDVKVLRVNTDEDAELAKNLDVHGIPTLQFWRRGRFEWRLLGPAPKDEIERRVKESVGQLR